MTPKFFSHFDWNEQKPKFQNGDPVHVSNAFPEDLAQLTLTSLEDEKLFKRYEGKIGDFRYSHHNIYEPKDQTLPLRYFQFLANDRETKAYLSELSGTDCMGQASFHVSWFKPSDYQLFHDDFGNKRQVALVWYLCENWRNEWGGQLLWKGTGEVFEPIFNSAILFQVGRKSVHRVLDVSPKAKRRRLAVSGWWRAP